MAESRSCAFVLDTAKHVPRGARLSALETCAECDREPGLLTTRWDGTHHTTEPGAQFLQDTTSWLSLATRSNASVELLIRYWQSSPSVGN